MSPSTGVTSIGGGSYNPQKAKAWGLDIQDTSKVRISGTEKVPVVMRCGSALGGPFGDLTMPDMSQAHTWNPVTLGQLVQTSAVYPEATIHLPDLNGGSIDIKSGWWAGGLPSTGIPSPPVMTRGN